MNYSSTPASGAGVTVDEGLRKYMLGIYNYMASGLAVSGIVGLALFNYASPETIMSLKMVGTVVTLGIILAMFFASRSLSTTAVKGMYWAFSASFGTTLAVYLTFINPAIVLKAFFITSGAFGALSLYGYTTKKDLSGMASFALMGLFGLLIAMIVNMIWPMGGMFGFIISVAGVVIFSIFTAYDTQNLKQQYYMARSQGELDHSAVWGAFSLYLNFINLFQFILSLLASGDD